MGDIHSLPMQAAAATKNFDRCKLIVRRFLQPLRQTRRNAEVQPCDRAASRSVPTPRGSVSRLRLIAASVSSTMDFPPSVEEEPLLLGVRRPHLEQATTLSLSAMTLRRWVIASTVTSVASTRICSMMSRSVASSSAELASSRKRIAGSP
ncbi:hypothetical protein EV132_103308 [Rhizobium sullae]|uniref:Uncharacterized protein n=1 Tax=Rhizobium sullae TaxID=50338 RepID=A0A4R3Q9U8_RHISU|nr:hypothetical protein EV132_103308 [Rhizobium sullae]